MYLFVGRCLKRYGPTGRAESGSGVGNWQLLTGDVNGLAR
jgi:hypothetical protein